MADASANQLYDVLRDVAADRDARAQVKDAVAVALASVSAALSGAEFLGRQRREELSKLVDRCREAIEASL